MKVIIKNSVINKYVKITFNSKSNKGFALIELLITLVIVAVSTTAFFSLQINSIKRDYNNYMRSQASTLIANVTEILRSSPNLSSNPNNPATINNQTRVFAPNNEPANTNLCNKTGNNRYSCNVDNDSQQSQQAFLKHQLALIQTYINKTFPYENYADRFLLCIVNSDNNNPIQANYRLVSIWLNSDNTTSLTKDNCPTQMNSNIFDAIKPNAILTDKDGLGGIGYSEVLTKI